MSNDVFHAISNLLSVSKAYSDFQLLPAFSLSSGEEEGSVLSA